MYLGVWVIEGGWFVYLGVWVIEGGWFVYLGVWVIGGWVVCVPWCLGN